MEIEVNGVNSILFYQPLKLLSYNSKELLKEEYQL